MGSSSNDKEELRSGAWTALEDKLLTSYIRTHGEGRWRTIPKAAGLKRCGKSCRHRWLNYLKPGIKRGNISPDEEDLIIRLHKLLGNRWSLIAKRLPGRTDNEIKNYWNTTLTKKAREDLHPSKKSGVSDKPKPPESEPKVIRTKATRCKKVVIRTTLSSSSPCEEKSTNINLSNISNPPSELQGHQNQFTNQFQDLESTIAKAERLLDFDPDSLNYLSSGRNYIDEFEMNAHHIWRDIKFDSNNVPAVDPEKSPSIDHRLMMNEYRTRITGFGDNATMDVDSLAYLLDSQDWLHIDQQC